MCPLRTKKLANRILGGRSFITCQRLEKRLFCSDVMEELAGKLNGLVVIGFLAGFIAIAAVRTVIVPDWPLFKDQNAA